MARTTVEDIGEWLLIDGNRFYRKDKISTIIYSHDDFIELDIVGRNERIRINDVVFKELLKALKSSKEQTDFKDNYINRDAMAKEIDEIRELERDLYQRGSPPEPSPLKDKNYIPFDTHLTLKVAKLKEEIEELITKLYKLKKNKH